MENKSCEDFAEFLTFMFGIASPDDQEMVGKYLGKLGRQRIEALDLELKNRLKSDSAFIQSWEKIKYTAIATNSFFHNISGLFKNN